MKLKKYIFSLIFILILVIDVIIGTVKYNENEKFIIEDLTRIVNTCEDYKNNDSFPSEDHKKHCDFVFEVNAPQLKNYKKSFSRHIGTLDSFMPFNIESLVVIYFIVLLSAYPVCKYLKSGIIKYDIERESIKKIKKKMLLPGLFAGLIPLIILIIIIIIGIINTGNITINRNLGFEQASINHPVLLALSSFIIAFSLGNYYSNIALIVSRKKHNFIVSSILAFLIVIGFEIFLETIFALIIGRIFNSDISIAFNTISIYHYPDSFGLALPVLFSLSLSIITSIIMIKLYKNKETLVIDCEK